jgi:hypothetical protein
LDFDDRRVPKYHTCIETVIPDKHQCGRQKDCDANGEHRKPSVHRRQHASLKSGLPDRQRHQAFS